MRRAGMHILPETLFSDSANCVLHAVSSAWSCAAVRSRRPGTGDIRRAQDCRRRGFVVQSARHIVVCHMRLTDELRMFAGDAAACCWGLGGS
eukprot:6480610-Amphidinium_carterae.1